MRNGAPPPGRPCYSPRRSPRTRVAHVPCRARQRITHAPAREARVTPARARRRCPAGGVVDYSCLTLRAEPWYATLNLTREAPCSKLAVVERGKMETDQLKLPPRVIRQRRRGQIQEFDRRTIWLDENVKRFLRETQAEYIAQTSAGVSFNLLINTALELLASATTPEDLARRLAARALIRRSART